LQWNDLLSVFTAFDEFAVQFSDQPPYWFSLSEFSLLSTSHVSLHDENASPHKLYELSLHYCFFIAEGKTQSS
jgi:hypothetical protein